MGKKKTTKEEIKKKLDELIKKDANAQSTYKFISDLRK